MSYADPVGTAFTYQGQLAVNGAPANGNYDFIFALYNSSSSGSQIGNPLITNGLVVSNGLFYATLDFGNQFSGTASWLAISVRTNNTGNYVVLTPRQALTPTPNAIFATGAANAASVANGSINSAAIATGTITAANIGGGQVVKSLNGLQDAVTLSAGNNVTITPSGETLTIAATGGQAVTSLNGLQGTVTLSGDSDITVSSGSGTLTLGSSATSANTASTIVKRDASGNFSAGTITISGTLNLVNSQNNTPVGWLALANNTSGSQNTANGNGALYFNTQGSDNTASGWQALYFNSTASWNTAYGAYALFSNTTGNDNTACGASALYYNVAGSHNTAVGNSAMQNCTSGSQNVAVGEEALGQNTSGVQNTAIGYYALNDFTSGQNNIALGQGAGGSITTGNNNIFIGNTGSDGDSGVIRIGTSGTHLSTSIAGIYNHAASGGAAVYIVSSGQLGTLPSSAKFKQNIRSMGDASDVLLNLRPVTFQYKPDIDAEGIPQFGLVAEEVEKVDPDLVVHDPKHGIYTVRYQAVDALLLNAFIKEHHKVLDQDAEIRALKAKTEDLDQLKERLSAIEKLLKSNRSASHEN